MIKTLNDLEVYQHSKKLFEALTAAIAGFLKDGAALKAQMLRSAPSIHANIAEGFGRSNAEFKNYLRKSLGSNNETISHIEDATALGYFTNRVGKDFAEHYTVLGKRIYTLRERWSVKKSKPDQTTTKH
jgi:four helix bundle protein